jgi:hypothetical protein
LGTAQAAGLMSSSAVEGKERGKREGKEVVISFVGGTIDVETVNVVCSRDRMNHALGYHINYLVLSRQSHLHTMHSAFEVPKV